MFKHCVYMIVLPHLVMIALVSFSRLSGRTSSGSRGVRLPTSSGNGGTKAACPSIASC